MSGVFNRKVINVKCYHYYHFYRRIIVYVASSLFIILNITMSYGIRCILPRHFYIISLSR